MKELKELLKRTFEIWRKMRWLKMIDREADEMRKLAEKWNRKQYVVKELVREYNERYGDSLTIKKKSVE